MKMGSFPTLVWYWGLLFMSGLMASVRVRKVWGRIVSKHLARSPFLFIVIFMGLSTSAVFASGKIGYGSRAGMTVTVVSMSGLDTANAVIRTKHTQEDAESFCREYVLRASRNGDAAE